MPPKLWLACGFDFHGKNPDPIVRDRCFKSHHQLVLFPCHSDDSLLLQTRYYAPVCGLDPLQRSLRCYSWPTQMWWEKRGQGEQTGKSDATGIPEGVEETAVASNGWPLQEFTRKDSGPCSGQPLKEGRLQCLTQAQMEGTISRDRRLAEK